MAQQQQPIPACHVVAIPYPGRGHINPMLNLCRLLLSVQPDILVSFILTEEWLDLLRDSPPPSPNFSYRTVPNVIPSEIGRGKDFPGFYRATLTNLEAPVEQLLDRLPPPNPTVIIYVTDLSWVVGLGNRRNIPVASFNTMSATVFSIFHHHVDLIPPNGGLLSDSSDRQAKDTVLNCIPGIPSIRVADLPTPFYDKGKEVLPLALESIKLCSQAQYLLFASVYELESQVIDALKEILPVKIYSLGLSIPHFNYSSSSAAVEEKPDYIKWLDAQPIASVLYISQGSFLSVSKAQLDETTAGVRDSGVRYLWVGRGEAGVEVDSGNGLVVQWCDQLRVLSHPCVGGFWSHCGWNSTKEAAFSGVPMMTFPIFWDQTTNSKTIVDDWGIGVRVKEDNEKLVRREDIARLVVNFMDHDSETNKERERRCKQVQDVCRIASGSGGSSEVDLLAFLGDITKA